MNIFLTTLPIIVSIFWMVTLILEYLRKRRLEIFLLAVFMMASALLYSGHFIFFNHWFVWIPFTDTVYRFCNLLVFPLYLIYILSLTERHSSMKSYLPLLLPAVLGGVSVGVLYLLMTPAETQLFIQQYLYGQDYSELTGLPLALAVVQLVLSIVFGLLVITTLVVGVLRILKFRVYVNSYYADTEGRMLKGVQFILIILFLASIVSLIANILGRSVFDMSIFKLAFPSLFFVSILYSIGYIGVTQDFTIADLPLAGSDIYVQLPPEPEIPRQNVASAVESTLESMPRRIEQLMQEQRLFLKPDLKVSDLAKALGTNEKYVSIAVNGIMDKSFSEYVNSWRISYAQQLLLEEPGLTVTEVARRSGYSTASSYYRNLKLYGKKED